MRSFYAIPAWSESAVSWIGANAAFSQAYTQETMYPTDEILVLKRDAFPPELLELPDPPEQLWLRGAPLPVSLKRLAVVGSRALSPYGRQACESLIAGLAGYPIVIISGLALGADACAHKAALAAGLPAIAVPGSGLGDRALYPRANYALAGEILAAGGTLLSEHEPAHKARAYDFPSRNRIMVGLADAVLVIEAGPKSGTLITARLASEYNRELLFIPHRIGDAHGFGAHLFLRMGAALATEPKHLLEALRITPDEPAGPKEAPELEGIEKQVWELLAEPKTRDELLRAGSVAGTPHSASGLLTALIALELRGLVCEQFGAWRRT